MSFSSRISTYGWSGRELSGQVGISAHRYWVARMESDNEMAIAMVSLPVGIVAGESGVAMAFGAVIDLIGIHGLVRPRIS